jgi:leucyl-tRNA synthetase
MQRNWIGRQAGASVAFDIPDRGEVEVFTTRLDTIHGATFFALSPGHEIAQEIASENDAVAEYVDRVAAADEGSEAPRASGESSGDEPRDEVDETSGVFTGEFAVNPATGEEIPVYVADYVLEDVGTGALYAVPAHDERDHAFAVAHGIPIAPVGAPAPAAADDPDGDVDQDAAVDPDEVDVQEAADTEDGVLVNSGEYDGLTSEAARERLVEDLDGERRTEYRLRDWGISRQRYWGTPIPMVECGECGFVPVPDGDLPVELPEFVHTTGNPLDEAEEWKRVDCPDCGGDAVRETDTMDTFVDSSWYFLRYVSPDLEDAPFDAEGAGDWLPVDRYVGGIEHAVMHLLYARFFTKVLDDMDMLDGIREPFADLTNQGMVLGEDGHKMSKSRGNGVSPERIVEEYGADTARLFVMAAAQPEKDFAWRSEGVRSAHDFVRTVHRLAGEFAAGEVDTRAGADAPGVAGDVPGTDVDASGGAVAEYVEHEIDAAAATATDEYEAVRFNHALQAVRELVALLQRYRRHTDPDPDTVERGLGVAARLLAPVAPHVAEEVWDLLGRGGLIAAADWPEADVPEDYDVERHLVEDTRADVRDIVEVAGIDDPEEIVVTVAPAWKHRVLAVAREAGGDVVGTVMQDDDLRERGEAAADYAKDLAGRGGGLPAALPPEREAAALERAAWLLREEFDAEVTVRTAAEAPVEAVEQARPGRPAIDVRE